MAAGTVYLDRHVFQSQLVREDKVGKGTSVNWPLDIGARQRDVTCLVIATPLRRLRRTHLGGAKQDPYGAVKMPWGNSVRLIWLRSAARLRLHDHAGHFRVFHHQRKGKGFYPPSLRGSCSAKIYRLFQARRHPRVSVT